MNSSHSKKTPNQINVVIAFVALAIASFAANAAGTTGVKILEARFDARKIVKVEAGDFHFKPGQIAPVHTHVAPAVGLVTKGAILYQVEGEKPVLLSAGDAFYEPAGPRILRFDNASATEEAIFVDFNLQQDGEPFIVFPEPPTEAIDRRTLPTVELKGRSVKRVDVRSTALTPLEKAPLLSSGLTLGWIDEGVVEIQREGRDTQRVVAGQSFAVTTQSSTMIVNASSEIPASIVTFELK